MNAWFQTYWTTDLINSLLPKANLVVPSKSGNADTPSVHNIPFDSHWPAYLRIDISSYESSHTNDFKNESTFYYNGYTAKL